MFVCVKSKLIDESLYKSGPIDLARFSCLYPLLQSDELLMLMRLPVLNEQFGMNGKITGYNPFRFASPLKPKLTTMIKKALTYGVLAGVIVTVYTLLLYALGMEYYASWWLAIIAFVLIVFLVFYFGYKVKKEHKEGLFDFKQAFIALLTIGLTASFVTVVWNVVLYNMIDTNLGKELTEHVIEQTSEMMEKFGTPESAMEEALAEMADMPEQFKTGALLLGWLKGSVMYIILAFIGGFIIREKTQTDNSALDRM